MLYPRIIPCLLVHNKGLVKTIKFKNPKYVGDPINAVKIFNEKEVDELIVLDIDASSLGYEPNYNMIEHLAVECRMPLCYGGGIKSIDQAQKIFSLGVEKIAISSLAIENPPIITKMAERVGKQSVVVVLDIKKRAFSNKYEIFTYNGKNGTGLDPITFAMEVQRLGAGEIVVNSIDQDGVMNGFDIELIKQIREKITIPMTVIGGGGNLNDISKVIKEFGVIGVAAGSMFVFKGKFRAVLINYPLPKEKEELVKDSLL
jgi:cyclase